jgi:hypothetical protein
MDGFESCTEHQYGGASRSGFWASLLKSALHESGVQLLAPPPSSTWGKPPPRRGPCGYGSMVRIRSCQDRDGSSILPIHTMRVARSGDLDRLITCSIGVRFPYPLPLDSIRAPPHRCQSADKCRARWACKPERPGSNPGVAGRQSGVVGEPVAWAVWQRSSWKVTLAGPDRSWKDRGVHA